MRAPYDHDDTCVVSQHVPGHGNIVAAGDVHFHAPAPAANDGPDSLDDEAHQALMREHEQREEFKRVTGIDERRSRRKPLQRLIHQLDFDAREIGLLYKHGYLFFKNEVLDLDQSNLPVIGVAGLLLVVTPFMLIFGAMFARAGADQTLLGLLCLGMVGLIFGSSFVVTLTTLRRWMTMRRLLRKWRASALPPPARGFRQRRGPVDPA